MKPASVRRTGSPAPSRRCTHRLPGGGWARRGTRPSAPQDQRTKWAYVFGAIRPAKGEAAGLVMPWADAHAVTLRLAEISRAVDPGAHAVAILDQAGWHMSRDLVVPGNIALMPLSPRSPELTPPLGICKRTPAGQPVENVWRFMRGDWLSNRVSEGCDDMVALCCEAWNKLVDQPWRIITIGMRDRAHGVCSMHVGMRPSVRCAIIALPPLSRGPS